MSTKKEKYMCNQCSRCAVENTAVLGCADDDCHCHQTESIEWKKEFDRFYEPVKIPGAWSDNGWRPKYTDEVLPERNDIKAFISEAITTAVAKRELEIAEEVGNMAGWNYDGTKAGNRDCPLIHREAVIQIIKH